MRILVKLDTLGMSLSDLEYPSARHAVAYRTSELLLEHTGREFETASMIMGALDPKVLADVADSWNTAVRDECLRQLETLATARPMPCDPIVAKAIPAIVNLSGEYDPDGSFLVIYEPEFTFQKPILRSFVQRSMLSDIRKEPAPYVVLDGTAL